MSDRLRITGLATGLDVDTMVKTMMKAENMKIDKLKQNRQLIQWRQELYREMTGQINLLKSTYFDVLKSDSYILSKNAYSAFDINPSSPTVATASANAGALPGTYTLKNITLAQTASQSGSKIMTKEAAASVTWSKTITSGENDTINVEIDGTSYGSITIEAKNYTSMTELASAINTKLADAKSGETAASTKLMALVSDDGTKIEFSPITKITSSNKEVAIAITEGATTTNYIVTLDEGSYTLKGLASAINKKLSTSVKQDGSNTVESIVGKIKFELGEDGESIIANPINSGITSVSSPTFNTDINLSGNGAGSLNKISTDGMKIDSTNNAITVNLGGTSYSVTLESGTYSDYNSLLSEINTKLSTAVNIATGTPTDISNKINVQLSLDGTRIQFSNTSSPEAQINISGNAMKTLGFYSSLTDIYPSGNDRMSSLLNSSNSNEGYVKFTINNKVFEYNFSTVDKDKTINDILSDISSKAGVKATYSELGQAFTLSSSTTGSDQKLTASESGVQNSFLGTIFGVSTMDKTGQNTTVTITDPKGNTSTVTKTTNSFTIDGMNYNLLNNDSTAAGVTITVTSNSQKTFDKIKAFVDKYNETIDKIRAKTTQKKQYSFKPLSDEEKEAMKEDEIKKWEEKAKEGLLNNDSMLSNMLNSMRRAFSDAVEGAGITLKEIGLSTDMDYTKGGRIVIDENKLKDAIQNKGDKVARLFTQDSKISYDPDHKKDSGRYNEIGIFQRINDIMKDYTRTSRDNNGKKGLLLEKAGIIGDLSEFENLLSKEIKDNYDKRINAMTDRLYDKESRYYQQFSKLESAMQKLNDQSNWLAQQLGSMGGR